MNFQFSVSVYLGYQQVKMRNSSELLQLDSFSQQLVDDDQPTKACIVEWARLFAAREKATSLCEFQKLVWKAHTAVIHHCQEGDKYHHLLAKLPKAEQTFAAGWAKMVHILAAACFPTDLVTLIQDGAGYLPLQVLSNHVYKTMTTKDRKTETFFEACRRRTVEATFQLVKMPQNQFDYLIRFWKRVGHNENISRQLPRVIVDLYHGSMWTKLRRCVQVLVWALQPRANKATSEL